MSDEEKWATEFAEEVWGIVQCFNCEYVGRMDGYIRPEDKRYILFVCPECEGVEKVKNPTL